MKLWFIFSKITQCGTMLKGVSRPICRSMNKGYPNWKFRRFRIEKKIISVYQRNNLYEIVKTFTGQIVTIGALNLCANINRLSAKNSSLIMTSKCWSVLWISFCTAALPRLCRFHAFGKSRKLSIFSNGDPSLNNLSGVTDW